MRKTKNKDVRKTWLRINLTAFTIEGCVAIMTLGGSPTGVAAPPTLLKMTIDISTGMGFSWVTSHSLKLQV